MWFADVPTDMGFLDQKRYFSKNVECFGVFAVNNLFVEQFLRCQNEEKKVDCLPWV